MPKFQTLVLSFVVSMAGLPALSQGVGSLSDGSLSMGQKVEEAPAAPAAAPTQEATSEIIGDWDLQCAAAGPEPRPCRMYQLLRDQSGNAVIEVTLFKLKDPAGEAVAGATIVVPLETLLTGQLTMAVDGTNATKYPFSFCNQVGCFARIGLSQADVDAMKKGNAATLSVIPAIAPDQLVSATMSLSGFTKAFDSAAPASE
ncbi:invasion associated locus B family protein [Shimia abyssi]|uniref:Invasion protein IalB n=1 Tax=Shimia abyssi TaxID=1662395 RepID=A0A2P8FCL3_9RHOB|nr:invasion associated locus B family protein [Shimia abyssi]PSL19432.1 invasion protein IalB [Shimia abyssi]